ncbi:expressed hypothetical protein [Trichoplax adhaerens]|uniref:ATP synthase subunit b n=1 Tax=Trichoplax adhaerens TaxID=10228 RepID=B3RRP7_TRIAD|nr:expressed hypothetical protein [Trichoplax adhaerens]EDV26906.1 expressed hypothetical protein [Trichoplax adhaerens]|eukprot:XP_002110902.1 expressed hypothetical protein [Trichoplax adhaerens]
MLSRSRIALSASYALLNASKRSVGKIVQPSIVILNNRCISQSPRLAKENAVQTTSNRTLKELIEEKTGTSGPYVLGGGILAYLLSKEMLVLHTETLIALSIFGVSYGIIRKVGKPTAEFLDQQGDEILDTLNEGRNMQMERLQEAIEAEKGIERMFDSRNEIFEVMKENNAMKLELEYRKRQQHVYEEVKKRLDYQVEVEQTKRRQEKEHIVGWLEQEVVKSISAQQEKDFLSQCFVDLKAISSSNRL